MATYYISNTGNDSNTNLQAQSQSTPWASLAKVSSTNFSPGDQILFKRGDTFIGQLTITSSGTSGNPITYGAYGSGAKPIITGMNPISIWFSQGSNIWSSPLDVGNRLNIVTISDNQKWMGRLPKTGWSTIATTNGQTSLTGNLPSTPNVNGGEVVIKKYEWMIEKCVITAHSGNTINFTNINPQYPVPAGWGYFVQNHVNACTLQGDWTYDNVGKSFKMYSVGQPSGVKVALYDRVILAGNKSYVTFDNLLVEGGNEWLIFVDNCSYFTFTTCDIRLAGVNGMNYYYGTGNRVESCTFTKCNNQALFMFQAISPVIRYNNLTQIGMIVGAGANDNESSNGMRIDATNGIVEYNYISYTGYCGINPSGTGIRVRKNFVQYHCMNVTDGGGIYMSDHNNTDKIIENNIVLNGYGNSEGTPYAPGTSNACFGIYLDEADAFTTVQNNVCAYNGQGSSGGGLYLHKAHDINVIGNLFFDNTKTQLKITQDPANPSINNGVIQYVRNIVMTNNVFMSTDVNSYIAWYYSTPSPHLDYSLFFSNINNNIYAKIGSTTDIVHTTTWETYEQIGYTLAQWKAAYSGYDVNSTGAPAGFNSVTPRLEYNTTDANKVVSLDGTYIDAINTNYVGTLTLPTFTGKILAKISNSLGSITVRGLRISLI